MCELLHAEKATVLATYGRDFYAGWPVVTENEWEEGYAYYVGTDPETDFLEHFYRTLCMDCGVQPELEAASGVEVRRRSQPDRAFIFLLNHNEEVAYVELGEEQYRDLLTGQTYTGSLPLRGMDVRILEEAPPEPEDEQEEQAPEEISL